MLVQCNQRERLATIPVRREVLGLLRGRGTLLRVPVQRAESRDQFAVAMAQLNRRHDEPETPAPKQRDAAPAQRPAQYRTRQILRARRSRQAVLQEDFLFEQVAQERGLQHQVVERATRFAAAHGRIATGRLQRRVARLVDGHAGRCQVFVECRRRERTALHRGFVALPHAPLGKFAAVTGQVDAAEEKRLVVGARAQQFIDVALQLRAHRLDPRRQ